MVKGMEGAVMKGEMELKPNPILRNRLVLRAFPKVELHRHLEGTFSVPTLHQIALKNGLDFPADVEQFRRRVQFPTDSEPDFLKFLSLFKNDWYRSLDDVALITYESVREFANDGLYYIELRFSPEHFALHNGFDRRETTRVVIDAADAAAEEIGLEIRYLITFNRNKQTQEQMTELYRSLRDMRISSIVGLDLAGDEINFPPQLFADFFATVNAEAVYKTTIHAGEVTPSKQIWDAVRVLGASRIGHGVSTIHDTELQKYLTDHQIVLEQCLTSNYQTGAWEDEKTHPIGALHRKGVPVTINSDDPFIQNTNLTDDYVKIVNHFGFSVDDLIAVNLRALNASFLPDTERVELVRGYQKAVDEFRANYDL
jgi:adenosine deaminase